MDMVNNVVEVYMRLNLNYEQHNEIYEVLSTLDKNIHKSRSAFMVAAVYEYIQKLKGGYIQTEENVKEVNVLDQKYRQEIKDMARDEVLHMLGAVIAGRESVSGRFHTQSNVMDEEKKNYEEKKEGITSEEALNLIAQWS